MKRPASVHVGRCHASAHRAASECVINGNRRSPELPLSLGNPALNVASSSVVQSLGHRSPDIALPVRRGILTLLPCMAGLQATQSHVHVSFHSEILIRIGNLAAELESLATRLATAQRGDPQWRSPAKKEQLSQQARFTATTGGVSNSAGECSLTQTLAHAAWQVLGERQVFGIPRAESCREPTVGAPASWPQFLAADPLMEQQHVEVQPPPPSQAPGPLRLTLPPPSGRFALTPATDLPSVWCCKSEYIREHTQEQECDAAPLECGTPPRAQRHRQVSQGGDIDGSERTPAGGRKPLKILISKMQQQELGQPASPKLVTGTRSTWGTKKGASCSEESHSHLKTEAIRKPLDRKMERMLGHSKHHCHQESWKRFSTM